MTIKTALIDIGTNSVRYLAAQVRREGGYSIIARGLTTPRLGEGLIGPGLLKEEAVGRTLTTLGRIRDDLSRLGVERFRTVGTEALRLAANGGDFIRRAGEIGFEVEIISGAEEARLVLGGALSGLPSTAGGSLLADVGGGSTELIPPGTDRPVSLPLGAVRLKEEFSPGREPDSGCRERMRERCRSVLGAALPDLPPPAHLVGLGGTFTTLAALRLGLEVYDGDRIHGLVLTRGEVEEIEQRLRGLSPARRERLPGLEPSRADIIVPGTLIVLSILERFSLSRVTISDRGLLFGLLEEEISSRSD